MTYRSSTVTNTPPWPLLPPLPYPPSDPGGPDRGQARAQCIHPGCGVPSSGSTRPLPDRGVDRAAANTARQPLDDARRVVVQHDVDPRGHVALLQHVSVGCVMFTYYHAAANPEPRDDDYADPIREGQDDAPVLLAGRSEPPSGRPSEDRRRGRSCRMLTGIRPPESRKSNGLGRLVLPTSRLSGVSQMA